MTREWPTECPVVSVTTTEGRISYGDADTISEIRRRWTAYPRLLALAKLVRDLLDTYPEGQHIDWSKIKDDATAAIQAAEEE